MGEINEQLGGSVDFESLDAAEATSRKQRNLPPRDDRTPQEIAAEDRKNAAERLKIERERPARMEAGRRIGQVKRTLMAAVEQIRHGEQLDAQDRAELAASITKDLGSRAPKAGIKAFVDTVAESVEDGDKATAWRISEAAAVSFVNAGWKPDRVPDPSADLSPDEVAAKVYAQQHGVVQ